MSTTGRRANRMMAKPQIEELDCVDRVEVYPSRIHVFLQYQQYVGEIPSDVLRILGRHELHVMRSGRQGDLYKLEVL